MKCRPFTTCRFHRPIIKSISMRHLIFVLVVCFLHLLAFSATPSRPAASPGPDQLRIAQMKAYSSLTVQEYEKLSGHKMHFLERAAFHLSRKRMKHMLARYDYGDVTVLQKISWLLKGFLFGPLALLAAYIFLKDDDRELIKWVWFGFAGQVVFIALLLIAFA